MILFLSMRGEVLNTHLIEGRVCQGRKRREKGQPGTLLWRLLCHADRFSILSTWGSPPSMCKGIIWRTCYKCSTHTTCPRLPSDCSLSWGGTVPSELTGHHLQWFYALWLSAQGLFPKPSEPQLVHIVWGVSAPRGHFQQQGSLVPHLRRDASEVHSTGSSEYSSR